MATKLPYHDGSRECTPVKCLLFVKEEGQEIKVAAVFTDNEEDKLRPNGHIIENNLILTCPKEKRSALVEDFTEALAKLGYQASLRDRRPSCIIFDLSIKKPT